MAGTFINYTRQLTSFTSKIHRTKWGTFHFHDYLRVSTTTFNQRKVLGHSWWRLIISHHQASIRRGRVDYELFFFLSKFLVEASDMIYMIYIHIVYYKIISRKPDINQIDCSRDTEGEHIHPIPALLMPISASTRDMSATLRQPSMLVSHSRKTACTCSLGERNPQQLEMRWI